RAKSERYADVIEKTGRVQISHVVVHRGRQIRISHLDADMGPDQLVADGCRTPMFDLDLSDLWAGRLRRGRPGKAQRAEQQQGRKPSPPSNKGRVRKQPPTSGRRSNVLERGPLPIAAECAALQTLREPGQRGRN